MNEEEHLRNLRVLIVDFLIDYCWNYGLFFGLC